MRARPGPGVGLVVPWGALLLAACGPKAPPEPRGVVSPPSRPAARANAGEPCGTSADCASGLRCAVGQCVHPACPWAVACLRKLTTAYPGGAYGVAISRWLSRITTQPDTAACREAPERIAALLAKEPWRWKGLCGAPPVPGVTRPSDRRHPFKIEDQQIKASMVPQEEPEEIRKAHLAHPDVCKAWVDFTLTRPFQGWVRARVYEQHDCSVERAKEREKDPTLKPLCKTRPYGRTDQRYLHLRPAGARIKMGFYFSTPPEVCRKPGLTAKTYPTGCFCFGIDDQKLTLDAVEDPFLFGDRMPGARPPGAKGGGGLSRPVSGLGPTGIPSCDAYLQFYRCYVGNLPVAARAPATAAFEKMLDAWRKAIASGGGAARGAIDQGCQAAYRALTSAMQNNPLVKGCLGP